MRDAGADRASPARCRSCARACVHARVTGGALRLQSDPIFEDGLD
jgi:hypothetical protein